MGNLCAFSYGKLTRSPIRQALFWSHSRWGSKTWRGGAVSSGSQGPVMVVMTLGLSVIKPCCYCCQSYYRALQHHCPSSTYVSSVYLSNFHPSFSLPLLFPALSPSPVLLSIVYPFSFLSFLSFLPSLLPSSLLPSSSHFLSSLSIISLLLFPSLLFPSSSLLSLWSLWVQKRQIFSKNHDLQGE